MDHDNQILRKFLIAVLFYVMAGLGPSLWGPINGWAQNPGAGQNSPQPKVAYATRSDSTIPLRNMPQIPPTPAVLGQIFQRRFQLLPHREGSTPDAAPDPVVQGPVAEVGAPAVGPYFNGVGNVNGVLPPDPSGDVGPNHYVQVVNLSYAIYTKSGTLLLGPANINTLWQNFGGACQNNNDGDPVVLYDQLADRWLISQFALPNFPKGPFYQCIAVSQTPDPTGSWHRYEFTISQTKLNDYPKFGVWPDGYYLSINQFTCNVFTCNWAGQGVVGFERSQMLAGAPARQVYFDLASVNSNLGGMLPSDLDGMTLPLAGSPNHYIEVDDNAWGYSPDQLQMWDFHVDWSNPANSTFTHATDLLTAAFDSNMCGYASNCIPQSGTTVKVDAISDRLMYRLQYRNFGDHETLVANHTVDVNGSDRAGIRWYELRRSGGPWSIYQQSTYTPTSDHRWMGSMAVNGKGDIALGYSRSSGSTFPSIYATGRLGTQATLNILDQPETVIKAGAGSQTHSTGRWGDYSQMTVDPVNDCTFWYTQEYYSSTSSASWKTWIGSFDFGDCGGGGGNLAPTASFTYSCTGLTCSFNGSGSSDPDGSIVSYSWDFGDGSPAGSGVTADHTYAAGGNYTVVLTVTDNAGASDLDSQIVTVTAPPSGKLHVGDLDGTSSAQNRTKWRATVTITIHDASHNAVANAAVSGVWSAGASGTASCTTTSTGQCIVTKTNIGTATQSVTFAVTNVTNGSLGYDSAANHDPDGDSNGTSIKVNK